jgi:hypothetical protein
MLDIRIPIGLMFSIFGVILLVFGVVSHFGLFYTDPKIYEQHSLGININCYWGGFMLVFGGVMLLLARWKKQS